MLCGTCCAVLEVLCCQPDLRRLFARRLNTYLHLLLPPPLPALHAEPGKAMNVAQLVDSVLWLHREFRGFIDIMGIGLGAPPADTVAEEGAAALAAAGAGAGSSKKDQGGDVRRFLNRLLGLPVARQNLLFNYFSVRGGPGGGGVGRGL